MPPATCITFGDLGPCIQILPGDEATLRYDVVGEQVSKRSEALEHRTGGAQLPFRVLRRHGDAQFFDLFVDDRRQPTAFDQGPAAFIAGQQEAAGVCVAILPPSRV